MRILHRLPLLLFFLAAACTTSSGERGYVLAFHTGGAAASSPRTLTFVAADAERARAPLFTALADAAGEHLRTFGYQPAKSVETADVLARLDWSVRRWSGDGDRGGSGARIGAGIGGGSRHVGYGVSMSMPLTSSGGEGRVRYHYRLRLELAPREGGGNLYEGTVEADSRAADPAAVLPRMMDVLFEDFPGISGKTRAITLPVRK